jgi:hypothetical protein
MHRETWQMLEIQKGAPVPLLKSPFWFRFPLHEKFTDAFGPTDSSSGTSESAAGRFEF